MQLSGLQGAGWSADLDTVSVLVSPSSFICV